jgi:hypothetical protein
MHDPAFVGGGEATSNLSRTRGDEPRLKDEAEEQRLTGRSARGARETGG